MNIKIVSFGQNINDVPAISITYKAQNLIPYAVASFEATQDGGGDINFTWLRRTRESSPWRDNVDMPISETLEAYRLEIINDDDQIVRTIEVGTNSTLYTATAQTDDFGGVQDSIKARVSQLSETVGKGLKTEEIFSF